MMRTIKKALAGLLLLLFVGYVASITLFYHTHIVNGQQVTHSHPYSDAPDTGRHTHSTAQYIAIAALSVLLMLAAFLACIFGPFVAKIKELYYSYKSFFLSRQLTCHALRGPPTC